MKYLPAVFALAFSGLAFGQAGELWFNFGESILSNSGLGSANAFASSVANDIKLDNGYRFGFRFGFNQGDHFGHEIQYAFNHSQLDVQGQKQAMHFHQGGYNFLYYLTSSNSRIRPFGTVGVMFDDFVPPGGGINFGSQNKFGANFGAGVKVHLTGMWAFRLDLREYVSGKPDFGVLAGSSGALWQTEASAGIGIGF